MEAGTCLSLPLTAGSTPRNSLLLGPQERKALAGFSRRCWKKGLESISCWVLMSPVSSQQVWFHHCLPCSRCTGLTSLGTTFPKLAHPLRHALGDTTCAAAFVWEMSSGCQEESCADDVLSREHETGEEISSGNLSCSCL